MFNSYVGYLDNFLHKTENTFIIELVWTTNKYMKCLEMLRLNTISEKTTQFYHSFSK